jgi:hypothetical protein
MAETPSIDLTKIDFPSDGLTIKTLRRLYPQHIDSEPEACANLFKDGFKDGAELPGGKLLTMLDAERFVADAAFVKACGVQCEPVYLEDAARSAAHAAELYLHYGLASGPQHAQQLVRGIESQAAEQARQHPGRGSQSSSKGRV